MKSGPLNFKASAVAQAQFAAVDDYGYHEEKGKGNSTSSSEEGLEIARLGIAQEIISSLAGRGITKLFPIQVILSFPFSFSVCTFCFLII